MSGPRTFFDASVLVAGAWADVQEHRAALASLDSGGWSHTHCLAEAFAQLTGKFRADPAAAAEVLRDVPAAVRWVSLSPEQVWQAVESACAAVAFTTGCTSMLHDRRVAPVGPLTTADTSSLMLETANRCSRPERNPALIRIETRAGHGAGKPTAKIIEEAADKLAFIGEQLGGEGGKLGQASKRAGLNRCSAGGCLPTDGRT